jgi:hypothetical protein
MDSIISELIELNQKGSTLLGVGPMSKNCVDATIELSNEYNIPIFLIASRRQIEAKELGGGYSNNWTTESFAQYVKEKDKKKKVILCRDHGGPWQNTFEITEKMNFEEAMSTTKKSFSADIKSGFKFLHIDPSENITSSLNNNKIFETIFELYEFCLNEAKRKNKEIELEISVGKDSDPAQNISEIENNLLTIEKFCLNNGFKKPFFSAIRIGTHVKERKNIGKFNENCQSQLIKKEMNKIIRICNSKKIMMKHHNTDYLSDIALKMHTKLGIHGANVAPEFGVKETTEILNLLKKNKLQKEYEEFIEISFNSNKWKKWIIDGNNPSKEEKAIIVGHYVFSNPEFLDLKYRIEDKLKDISDLDEYLKNSIKGNIKKYLQCFKLI